MGGREKVPRPARVTQSGQETNNKRHFDVLLCNQGKDIIPWMTLKSKKSSWLDCGSDRGAKGGFTTSKISEDLLVPEKNATENPELLAFLRGTLGPETPVAPFTRNHPNPEADWWRDQ